MRKSYLILIILIGFGKAQAQQKTFQFSAGPELLKSFNHSQSYWGTGATIQAEAWVKPALGLGLSTGFYHFWGSLKAIPSTYTAIPMLALIRYPIPVVPGLYGQDVFGYTVVKNVQYQNDGATANGGFTYYFSLGYVIKNHIDISVKVGRSRLDKKDKPVNVNEHNLGLKIAYRF